MKKAILFLTSILITFSLVGQETYKLDYCNCVDNIEQTNPVLNGKFERQCKGKLIEKGEFLNGGKAGEWISYSKSGKLIAKINYKNGLLNGKTELFYANGNPKLVAEFEDGKKTGNWVYLTQKNKTLITGSYESGKPIGIWTINDYKGKKPVVQYDFSTNKYITNSPYEFHKDNDIIQNSNTEEWYIIRYPARANNTKSAPLGGFLFAGDLFVELVEVPLDYWDTYIQYDYKVLFTVSPDNSTIFKLTDNNGSFPEDKPCFSFLIITNPESKIKKIEHSKLSRDLLKCKINEALNFLPPWIYNESTEVDVYISYVINKIMKQ
jgi:hypothetical protein